MQRRHVPYDRFWFFFSSLWWFRFCFFSKWLKSIINLFICKLCDASLKAILKKISSKIKPFQLIPVCNIRVAAQLQGTTLCQHCLIENLSFFWLCYHWTARVPTALPPSVLTTESFLIKMFVSYIVKNHFNCALPSLWNDFPPYVRKI